MISAAARVTGGPLPADFLIAPDALSDSVAMTEGKLLIDESGAATYTVPLYAVPGTAGMTPELSLRYSNRNGYGPLGKGWSIAGISAITRCRMTREAGDFNLGGVPTDGNPGPINFSETDRYCLEGARLISAQANSGDCTAVSGMTAINLRTEVDTLQRVCGYAPSAGGSGIAFFTVERQGGTISWYGDRDNNTTANRSDGFFNSARSGYEAFALSWALTRNQDASGNYIDYVYLKNQDGAVGEHLLSEVRYTGKTVLSGQSGSALAPYAKLSFNYSVRPAAQQSKNYAYGGQLSQVHRLDSVVACASGGAGACSAISQARAYHLTYATSVSGSGFETLTAIQECRDTAKTSCATPTAFDWSQASNGFVTTSAWNPGVFPSTKALRGLKFGDIDGDGRTDMVWVQAGVSGSCSGTAYINVAFGDLDGGRQTFIPANQFVTCAPAQVPLNLWELFDYNGDGRADLMLPGPGGKWVVYPSLGRPNQSYTFDLAQNLLGNLSTGIPVYQSQYGDSAPQLIDVNGDAQLDALYQTDKAVLKVRLMQPNAGGWGAELAVNVADFKPFEPCPDVNASPNCLNFRQYVLPRNSRLKYQLLDLDGDGRSDLKLGIVFGFTIEPQCPYCAELGGDYVYRVTDISSTQITVRRYDALGGSDYRLGDVNGDGLTDKIMRSPASTPSWSVSLNTGIGFSTSTQIGTLPNDSPTDGLVKLEDVNRDGRADLLYIVSESNRKVFRVRYALPNGNFGPESVLNGNNAEACAGSGCDPKLKAHMFADLDADGNLDYFALKIDDNPDFYLSQPAMRGVPRDVVTRITNGYGAKTELRYSPLTNAEVYRRDSNTRALSYGRGSIINDLFDGGYYVVSQVSSSAPTLSDPDAMANVYYRYSGAKIQGGGRGFLGFRDISVFDTSRAAGYAVTSTTYRQDFPFVGLAARTVKRAFPSQTYTPSNCLISFPSFNCYSAPAQGFVELGGVVVADSTQLWESDIEIAGAAVASFTPGVQAPAQVRAMGVEESVRDLATGTQTKKTITAFTYGSYGNIVQSVMDTFTGTSSTSAQTIITSNSYIDDVPHWRIGLLAGTTVTYKRPGSLDVVRTMAYTRELSGAATGLLTEERHQAAGPADQALTKAYVLDAFGNRVQETACAAPASSCTANGYVFQPVDALAIKRYSRVEYDAQGRFVAAAYEPFATTNGAGYEEKPTTRNLERDIFGNVIRQLDLNSVQTIASFGRMGRAQYMFTRTTSLSERTQGITSLTTYRWCGTGSGQVSCPAGARFRMQVTQTAQPRQWTYFDALGRAMMAAGETLNIGVQGADVSASCADYDTSGNLTRRSVPFFLAGVAGQDGPVDIAAACAAAQRQWMIATYDVLQRPLRVLSPDTADILMTHSGLNTTSSDPRRNATTQTRNGLDEIVSVIDAAGTITTYSYTADGQVATVSRSAGSGTISNVYEYDAMGRNTLQTDPDVGTTLFQYNALDELVAQTDNTGSRIELQNDARGRPFRKTVKLPDGSIESVSALTFDTAMNGAGRLAAESIVDANADWAASGQVAKTTQLSYDALGRQLSSSTFIGDEFYGASVQYDSLGRPWKSQDASSLWTKTEYSSRGHAVAICASHGADTASLCPASADTYQRTLATDAWGHALRQLRANNPSMEVVQSYQPDNGRLQRICAGDANCQLVNEAYSWDAAGNLSSRQKESRYLEIFAYDALNRLKEAKLVVRNGAAVNEVTLAQSYDVLGNVCSKNGTQYAYPGADGCPMQAGLTATALASQSNILGALSPNVPSSDRPDARFEDRLSPFAARGRAMPLPKARNAVAFVLASPVVPKAAIQSRPVSKIRPESRRVKRGFRYLQRGGAAGAPVSILNGVTVASLTPISSPHAVSQVGTGGTATLYSYDPAGRQVGRDAPGTASDRTIVYTADGDAREIRMGNGQRIRYWYGADGQRYRKQDGTRTTLYLGNVEVVIDGGTVTYRRYIAGVVVQTVTSGVATTRYLFHDHIGSVVRIANPDGSVAESLDYAADGLRRSTVDPRNTGSASALLPRGFTGHEMLDGTDTIHMNGRMYDPQLGRFLQADPFVQIPTHLQSWNPYSYVDNNPLTYNDPSGYLIGAIAAAVAVTLPTITVTASVVSIGTIATVATAAAATVAVTAASASGVAGAYSGAPTNNSAADNSTSSSTSQAGSEPYPGAYDLPDGAVAWVQKFPHGGEVLMANGETQLVLFINGGLPEAAPVAAGIGNAGTASGLGQLQTALDVAGFIPIVGIVADVANAGIYAYHGSYGMAAMAMVGAVPIVGDGIAIAAKGARAASKLSHASKLGREGEEAVRGAYEIGEKVAVRINGRLRIPDGINDVQRTLGEIKNVDKLSYTRQLRDYSTYAQKEGYRFDLYTRSGTKLSGPLKQAIDNGLINHLQIPGL